MNKDALLATAIGFFIGLCITGLLLAGPSLIKMLPNMSFALPKLPQVTHNKAPSPTKAATDFSFSVDSPLPDAIESDHNLLVSGKSTPHATVVIQGNTDDAVVETTDDGKFAGKVTLSEGKNKIVVTSYTKDTHTGKELIVYYTPEEL